MRRIAAAAFGATSYSAFLLSIGYLVFFLADIGVPKSVNRGAGLLGGPALAVDLALILLFGLQHSVMARPGFKRAVQAVLPPSLERSVFVLASGLTLAAVLWLWRPIPAVLWDAGGTVLEPLAWVGYVVAWALAVGATFALGQSHMLGLAQLQAWGRHETYADPGVRSSSLYRVVRHPVTAGLTLALWCVPRMTAGHLLFAVGMTLYCIVGTLFEERDLIRSYGDSYRAYRRRVPALVPFLRPGRLAPRSGSLSWELSVVTAAVILVSLAALRGAGSVPEGAREGVEEQPPAERLEVAMSSGARAYEVFDPGRGVGERRPIVLALHGTGGTPARLRTFTGGALERVAGARGWIVAYGEAVGGTWSDCRVRSDSAASAARDDMAYLRAVVSQLALERGGDPTRVYIIGYSGGGHMAFRVALEDPGLASAIAVFGASLPMPEESACAPVDGAVSTLLVNGTADLVSPYRGGDVVTPTGRFLGAVRSSRETLAYFERRAEAFPRERAGERRAPETRLVTIEGGGHAIPGRASRFPRIVGSVPRSWEGIEAALSFFEHGTAALRGPCSGRPSRSLRPAVGSVAPRPESGS